MKLQNSLLQTVRQGMKRGRLNTQKAVKWKRQTDCVDEKKLWQQSFSFSLTDLTSKVPKQHIPGEKKSVQLSLQKCAQSEHFRGTHICSSVGQHPAVSSEPGFFHSKGVGVYQTSCEIKDTCFEQ